MTSSFENQGFLVVNGTQGIAPEVIRLAANRRATVVFTAQHGCESAADKVVAQAQADGLSDRVSYIISNLEDEDTVEKLADAALERLPSLNVLIHSLDSVAVLEHKPLLQVSLSEWNQVLSTELRVPFMLARRTVEEFLFARVPGRIVYVAYGGEGPVSDSTSYATAHAGLNGLVRCVTKEFGRRELSCNAVMVRGAGGATSSKLVETILFLASGESSFVNGEFLNINAGSRDLAYFELGETKAYVKG